MSDTERTMSYLRSSGTYSHPPAGVAHEKVAAMMTLAEEWRLAMDLANARAKATGMRHRVWWAGAGWMLGFSAEQRHPVCVSVWPECESGRYDPRCCRFPKSCSA